MKYVRLFALLLIAALPCLGETAKYQDVIYPQGMPEREDPFTGQQAKTEYTFYDEAVLEKDGRIAVLYSEKLPRKGSDGTFWAFVAVLLPEGGKYRVSAVREVTDLVPSYVEFPGNFLSMDGTLDTVQIGDRQLLHLNVWSVLSGTGFTSAASDAFFPILKTAPNDIQPPVLMLEKSSAYSRMGADSASYKASRIYLLKDALAVETVTAGKSGPATSVSVYELKGAAFEKTGKKMSPEELAKEGLRLKRSQRIVSEQELN
jgi:hypothetical protein